MPSLIHLVDVAAIATELRPICGEWSDDVTWTTIPALTSCPRCMEARAKTGAAGVVPVPARVARVPAVGR